MNFQSSVRVALTALFANKMRSILTMLGIIIGVAAVIILVSIGNGLDVLISQEFESFGTNMVYVFSKAPGSSSGGPQFTTRGALGISNGDAAAIDDPEQAPSVSAVVSSVQRTSVVIYGGYDIQVSVEGTVSEAIETGRWELIAGRFITQEDLEAETRVAIIGSSVMEDLFPSDVFPIDETIRIDGLPFRVVGILAERGGSFGSDLDAIIYVPLTTAQRRLFDSRRRDGQPEVDFMQAQAVDENAMDPASVEIADVLRERHNIIYRDMEDFEVVTSTELLSAFQQITGALTIFLGVIAGISLLVGGIGIMNIMLVSVTERTREIGLRKAVGAKRRDILTQFLIESVVLSVLGGLIGVTLGASGSLLASAAMPDLTTSVTFGSILLATSISTLIGLFFGIYPAYRAASLNPIDALRYE